MKSTSLQRLSILHRPLTAPNQQGSALVVTLLAVTILIGLAVEFAYEVYIDTSATSNWSNAQRASLMATSGQTLGSSYVREMNKLSYTYPREFYLPVEKDFGPDTSLFIRVEDENAKFNINSLISAVNEENDFAFDFMNNLCDHLGIDRSVVLFIADWIDGDHEPRLKSSEDGAKNSYLFSIEELLSIKGVDREVFDTIHPFLTTHGGEWSKNININTAPLPVLLSLHEDMTEILAQRIIDYRDNTPFKEVSDIRKVSGMNEISNKFYDRYRDTLDSHVSVMSRTIRVTSTGRSQEITRIIESILDSSSNIRYWREI